MRLPAALTVFQYECRRTAVLSRLGFGSLLALFPVALVAIIQYQGGPLHREWPSGLALFNLVPGLTCILGLMLWATPIVQSELEARTWPYLAVRPSGKGSILFGKYLTAVCWTAMVAWLSLTLSILVLLLLRPETTLPLNELVRLQELKKTQMDSSLDPDQQKELDGLQIKQSRTQLKSQEEEKVLGPMMRPIRTWCVLAALAGLSAIVYGALFTFFGVLLLRRGMALAVAYTFMVEVMISLVPAIIHQLTVQYHLRCLGVKWMQWTDWTRRLPIDERLLISDVSPWLHVLVLLGFTAVLLTLACLVLRQRQLVRGDEI